MRRGRGWVLTWWLSFSLGCLGCEDEPSRRPDGDAGSDGSVPSGPLGRIQGRVQLTEGTGLGGVGVAALGVSTRTDELGIFVLDVPVGQEVVLAVESDYYTSAHTALEVIENSSVSAALEVVPLKRLELARADKESTLKGDDGFAITVPASSLRRKDQQKVSGKAEVRYALLNEPNKMRAAPGDLSAREKDGAKQKLEAFGVVEVRFYQDNERLLYDGAPAKVHVPMHKGHGLKQGASVASYHFDEKAAYFQSKGAGKVVGNDAVFMADEFSAWCAARPLESLGCVSGRVVDPELRPAPFASVELLAQTRLATARTSTGTDGRFCLESIRATPHVLRALSALGAFSGHEQEITTGAQAASCGSDACLDLGDIPLETLLLEAATPGEGTLPTDPEMDAGADPDAGPGEDLDGAVDSDAGDASLTVTTPIVCGTPIWLSDPSTCRDDLVAGGGTTTFALNNQTCAALWLCADDFNRITLQIDHSACMRTSIYGPNRASPVHSGGNRCTGTLLDDIALDAQGPHLIVIESTTDGPLPESLSMTLWSVGSDPMSAATLDGEPVRIAITEPGQNGSFTFVASAGERIALTIAATVLSDYSLRSPTGLVSVLGAHSGNFFSDSFVVAETGTYTVQVDPRQSGISNFDFQVFRVPADPEAQALVGAAQPVSFAALKPGQNGSFTFTGTAGQRVAFVVSGSSLADVRLTRVTGTGNVGSWAGSTVFSDLLTLEEAGSYRIVVDPRGQGTGTYTLSLWSVPSDLLLDTSVGAASITVNLATPGQNAHVTFHGDAGQRVAFRATPSALMDFVLWPPVGTQSMASWAESTGFFSDVVTLPQGGSYKLSVNPRNQNIDEDLTVQFFSVPADLAAQLSIDGGPSQITIVGAGQNGEFSFNLTSSPRTVALQLTTNGGTTDYRVISPTGAILSSGAITNTGNPSGIVLNETGTYRIALNPRGDAMPVLSASVSTIGN